jgi:hypothetical protein
MCGRGCVDSGRSGCGDGAKKKPCQVGRVLRHSGEGNSPDGSRVCLWGAGGKFEVSSLEPRPASYPSLLGCCATSVASWLSIVIVAMTNVCRWYCLGVGCRFPSSSAALMGLSPARSPALRGFFCGRVLCNRFCGIVSGWGRVSSCFLAAHMTDLAPPQRGFYDQRNQRCGWAFGWWACVLERQARYGNKHDPPSPASLAGLLFVVAARCATMQWACWPPSRSGATASAKDIPARRPPFPPP